jgi:ABC-type lipoprotein export system ATPase subunit
MALLELQGVTRTFESAPGAPEVLKGVDFSIDAGQSAAIVGPSGCGKSTLLNLIGTLDKPTGGTISFDGRDIQSMNDGDVAAFRNRSIGFVFQLHHLLPQCTALENVLVPTLVNSESKDAKARAEQLLERVGLKDRMHYRPGLLSGGERQRVAVVRALINQPRLLLADEPTGSLSPDGAMELAHLMLELNREEDLALIVVTHSTAIADTMDSVYAFEAGQLSVQAGTAS